MLKTGIKIISLMLVFVSSTVQAFEKHGYVDVDASAIVIQPKGSSDTVGSTAYRILLGKAINPYMRAEGVFAFGSGEGTFTTTENGTDEFLGTYDATFNLGVKLKSMFGVNVRINTPITNLVDVYTKFGFASLNLKETLAGNGTFAGGEFGNVSGNFSETYTKGNAGLAYGAGLDIHFSNRHAMSIAVERFPNVEGNFSEYIIRSFSIGYIFKFK